jgi:HEAT repeat protein
VTLQSGPVVAFLALMCLVPQRASAGEPGETFNAVILECNGIGNTGEDLVRFLQTRVAKQFDPALVEELIQRMGSEKFEEREQASAELEQGGAGVLGALEKATKDRDMEIAKRSRNCIARIESNLKPEVALAVIRTLVRKAPRDGVRVLLGYLPSATNEEEEEAIWHGLDELTVRMGKVDPACAAALKDKAWQRRAVAGYLLTRRGNSEQRDLGIELLKDAVPLVRLRTAQGLLGARDERAIPTLVRLLDQESVAIAWQAEELLVYIGNDNAPNKRVATGSPNRRKQCYQAWMEWWKQTKGHLDWRSREANHNRPGLLLLTPLRACEEGCVSLIGCDGTERFRLPIAWVIDAQMITGDQLLVGQCPRDERSRGGDKANHSCVTIRDFNGLTLWEHQSALRIVACRQALGDKVIMLDEDSGAVCVARNQVEDTWLDTSRTNFRPVHPYNLSGDGSFLAEKKDQHSNKLVLISARAPRAVQSLINANEIKGKGFVADVVGNGFIVVRDGGDGQVIESDFGGSVFWEYKARVANATRLRNGTTLISGSLGILSRLAEIDTRGKVVWEVYTEQEVRPRPCLNVLRLGFDPPGSGILDLGTFSSRVAGLSAKAVGTRRLCAAALDEMGQQAASAVPKLIEALDDNDEDVRHIVGRCLDVALTSKDFPTIVQMMKDKRSRVRAAGIHACWRFGDRPKVIVPLLLNGLHDESLDVRANAAEVLSLYPPGPEVVNALATAIMTKENALPNPGVASSSARTLATFGGSARLAVPTLLNAIKSDQPRLALDATRALGEIAAKDPDVGRDVLPALIGLVKQHKERPEQSRVAILAMGAIGPKAKAAVPALLGVIRDKKVAAAADPDSRILRQYLMKSLGEIGPEARDAIPDLVRVLEENDETRFHRDHLVAATALGGIGPAAKAAIPVLQRLAADDGGEYSQVREACFQAISNITP